jgi:hypothetical protein
MSDTIPTAASSAGSADQLAAQALERYLREDYEGAATGFEAALAMAPDHDDWGDLLAKARANAHARIDVPVPPRHFFTREQLLAPPAAREGVLPSPPRPIPLDPAQRIQHGVGDAIGEVISLVMEVLTTVWGRIAGFHGRVWTNWYHRGGPAAVLTLAHMRNRLNALHLPSVYPKGARIAFQPEDLTPPPGVTHFRTADGSWNNLDNPREGSAGTRFVRNVPAEFVKPETPESMLTPNPRVISLKLLSRNGPIKEFPYLNMLAASWINFQNSDWISHGENNLDEMWEIPLAEDDPARKLFGQPTIRIPKTRQDTTYGAGGEEPVPITFINEVSQWWDGSQIYGSDQATQDRVRSHADGKLLVTEDGRLPVDERGIEITGFTRNWWLGLSLMHTLFTQEHNSICDMLKMSYPEWDDNRLFNVARLINTAGMAKIHTVEWTPAILPNPVLNNCLNANWYGLITQFGRRGTDKKTIAPIKIRNPEGGGVVGNPINKHDAPFGLSQEFVEIYRLHSLLPEELIFRRHETGDEVERAQFTAVRQAGSAKLTARMPMADLLYSFGVQQPGQLILNNYPKFFQELSVPGNPLLDMGAVDIFRARERGVPRYNDFRRGLGLPPLQKLEDLTDDAEALKRIREVYGDGDDVVENLDLMVGTLAEGHRPTGFGFGETMFQIFIFAATRRLQADRFYTDGYNEETYTAEGLDWVDRTSLKRVLLRHHPDLGKTGLGNITNAFEPWDLDEMLDLERHPLRAYDPQLKPDPARGDLYRA